ncbi:hypothetical protein ACWCYL_19835 [Streptomyces sp. 900105755]
MADLEGGLNDGDRLPGERGDRDPFGHQADPVGPRDQVGNGQEVLRDDLRVRFDALGVQAVQGGRPTTGDG